MDAEWKRDVGTLAPLRAGAIVGARKRLQPDFHVAEASRIEERLPGDAARAPVFLYAVVLAQAEVAVELRIRKRPQRVLVQDRNPAPDFRIIELVERQVFRHALLPERRTQGLLDGNPLLLTLDALDVRAGARQRELHDFRMPMKRI